MDVDVLFAGAAVTDFDEAQAWYERFFGRAPDLIANDEEVMWQLTSAAWLYIVRDTRHAGNSIVAMAVSDIEETTGALEARGVVTGPIEQEGEAGRKALVRDPDGNSIAIIEVAHGEHDEHRSGAAAQAAEWDTRYGERAGSMWSGRPNGRLVAEVADLTPGRALDVGCGEGADAMWLARRGWTVTAIDISDVALGRAREAAELAGASVEWICGDALQAPFPAGSFDLVSMQYPALPKAAGDAAVRTLLDTVRPGGLLLAVYHDLDDDHREHMKSRGIDPADYVGADDLGRSLGDDFTVEIHAVEPRIDPPPGTPHIADVVLRARRR